MIGKVRVTKLENGKTRLDVPALGGSGIVLIDHHNLEEVAGIIWTTARRAGLEEAARAVCPMCLETDNYGPARRIEGWPIIGGWGHEHLNDGERVRCWAWAVWATLADEAK